MVTTEIFVTAKQTFNFVSTSLNKYGKK